LPHDSGLYWWRET